VKSRVDLSLRPGVAEFRRLSHLWPDGGRFVRGRCFDPKAPRITRPILSPRIKAICELLYASWRTSRDGGSVPTRPEILEIV